MDPHADILKGIIRHQKERQISYTMDRRQKKSGRFDGAYNCISLVVHESDVHWCNTLVRVGGVDPNAIMASETSSLMCSTRHKTPGLRRLKYCSFKWPIAETYSTPQLSATVSPNFANTTSTIARR
ncbi:hypothetical protein EVAR_81412_1 [Eumeta japonica]|uniref:Uncharacterized protein n=1 Tax=Eumeta variegata TaxID=151549 RepID=A0A4C1WH02_EUMVA|nr:hypothetical protein EVAR_81412_1 [Eumeta japonica]